MDRSPRQKLNKEIFELIDIIKEMDLTDIYRTFHSNTEDYTFLLAPHRTCSKTDHILGHKASLKRYKKTEITPCILCDHYIVK